jgi:HlyD family secretion protein
VNKIPHLKVRRFSFLYFILAQHAQVIGMAAESLRRRLPDPRHRLVSVWRERTRVTYIHRTTAVCAAALIASFAFAATALAQNSNLVAPGRVEGAGPTLSMGVAAAGIVDEVLVREGSRVRAGETLIKLDCRPTEADVRTRNAQLEAAQAAFDRASNGSRPDEIVVGEAVVGYSQARAEEAQKTLERTEELKEGVTVTTAHILEVQRDARISAAQLAEARARLSLLRAGSREEDIRRAKALRDAAAADLDSARARLDQCTVRAPVDGTVIDVLASTGQYLSLAVPQPLLHLVQDGQLRVRAEVEVHDASRVCAAQIATIVPEAFPNAKIRAHVASISPMVTPRSITSAAANANTKDVLAVMLDIDTSTPTPPIGSAVTVNFDPCPSKT